jgi:isopenicillin N synthase-like dioxygenase
LPVFATALDLPPGYFDEAFRDAQCVLRLSHFPPARYGDNQFGLAPHTDANFFTVLPQANVEGLYIRPAGRGWIKAPRIPGSFVINAGDMLKRWTNDRFLSTQHRRSTGRSSACRPAAARTTRPNTRRSPTASIGCGGSTPITAPSSTPSRPSAQPPNKGEFDG